MHEFGLDPNFNVKGGGERGGGGGGERRRRRRRREGSESKSTRSRER